MQDTVPYVFFLVVGVLLVFIDGQLLRRSGTTYLKAVYPDVPIADSVNQLITVLFHLVGLGVLALISAINLDAGAGLESLVVRLGILLLVLALAHGITIWALAKLRSRQQERSLRDQLANRTEQRLDRSAPPDQETSP